MTTLDVELAAAAGRRWWNRWTIVLGVGLLLVGGFVAGVEVQKAYGSTPATAGGAGQRAGFSGGGYGFPGGGAPGAAQGGTAQGGTAQGGTAQGAADATTGTIKLVDGTTIYVQTESGAVITIRTDGETTVQVPGALKDLKAGDKITVAGESDTTGSVTATTVTKTP